MKSQHGLLITTFFVLLSACAAPLYDDSPASPNAIAVSDSTSPPHDGLITLINGDTLVWSLLPSGRVALDLDPTPRADDHPIIFVTEEADGQAWTYPASVRAWVNAGSLDRAFFNIPALIEQGSISGQGLPVTLIYDDHAEFEAQLQDIQFSRLRTHEGVNAAAAVIDSGRLGDFWAAVTSDAEPGTFSHGISRVLLNDGSLDIAPQASGISATDRGCDASEHLLTVQGIRRNGQPAAGSNSLSGFGVLNVDDAAVFSSNGFFVGGTSQVCVPPGTYSVLGAVNSYDPDFENGGIFIPLEWVMVGNPEFTVDQDTTVVLDARDASEITFSMPEATERADLFFRLQWRREAAQNGGLSGGLAGINNLENHPVGQLRRFAGQTAAVLTGELELLSDARLVLAGQGADSPVLYDLAVIWQEEIPADLNYLADPGQLVAVTNSFYSDILPQATMKEFRSFWRPWQQVSVNAARDVRVRLQRTEYLVGGDTRYQQRIDASGQQATTGPGRMDEPETFYQPAEQREQAWFKQPMRPGVREIGSGAAPVVREDDTLVLLMPEWVDTQPGHFGFRHTSVDTTAFRFLRDGQLVATAPRPRGNFPMVPEPAEYRLELDIERNAPWRFTSTQTHTAWTLRSENPGAGVTEIVPLMLLDYEIDLDLGNNTTPETQYLDITARYQAGSSGPPRAGERAAAPDLNVRLSVSRDDGSSWQAMPGQDLGDGRFRFDLAAVHAIGGFVSLRANARDRAGNRIEQDIIRAYSVPEQIPPLR